VAHFLQGSSPTRSTEDGDSHRGPCESRRWSVRAGDEEAGKRGFSKVAGSVWRSFGSGSFFSGGGKVSSSLASGRAGLGHDGMARWWAGATGGEKRWPGLTGVVL
jgi:hypothetical protein